MRKKVFLALIATAAVAAIALTGCEKSKDEPTSPQGLKAVDLGLSVKWANMNIGATTPGEYGDYFAWGETSPKTDYSWSTYKWCNGVENTLTKYCNSSYSGTVDDKEVLDPEDDAAHVNWGGNWRMPTKAEQDELRNNCTWDWVTLDGVDGYLVTSNKNGNQIFLPAAGWRENESLENVGSRSRYWSSVLARVNSSCAYDIEFESERVAWAYISRTYGLPIRPVCQ